MKIMREEGWGRGALRRWIPIGIVARGWSFLDRVGECKGTCEEWVLVERKRRRSGDVFTCGKWTR